MITFEKAVRTSRHFEVAHGVLLQAERYVCLSRTRILAPHLTKRDSTYHIISTSRAFSTFLMRRQEAGTLCWSFLPPMR